MGVEELELQFLSSSSLWTCARLCLIAEDVPITCYLSTNGHTIAGQTLHAITLSSSATRKQGQQPWRDRKARLGKKRRKEGVVTALAGRLFKRPVSLLALAQVNSYLSAIVLWKSINCPGHHQLASQLYQQTNMVHKMQSIGWRCRNKLLYDEWW